MAAESIATDLVALIAQLKQQHKAGITPSYGQVDGLFELGERLGVSLQAGSLIASQPDCTVVLCVVPAVADVAGRPFCAPHAVEARSLLEQMRTLMPAVFERVTRVEWPLGEDDEIAGVRP